MWDARAGKFFVGTTDDGVTVNKQVIAVDVQAWGALVLGKAYTAALNYAEKYLRVGGGFDFNQDRDGIWYEGSAQMALADRYVGLTTRYNTLMAYLQSARSATGALLAASKDGLTTGLQSVTGIDWLYYRRLAAAPTAWLVLAAAGFNPFKA